MDELTPKQLMLAILRVAPGPMAVRELVAIGGLFGFEESAVRVTLARLVQRGHVANEGAAYALTSSAAQLGRWVEEWRRGEARLRSWNGSWLCVLHPGGVSRTPRRKSVRALERLGFRQGQSKMWVRPDNLRKCRDDVEVELIQLGLAHGAELFIGNEFSSTLTARWMRTLWDTDQIEADLRASLIEMEKSRSELESLPDVRALVESFLLGGRAVTQLALDPLLPDEILDGTARRDLTEALHEYDQIGRALWNPDVVASLWATPREITATHERPP